ncbi:MAG: polymerase ECF-type sigma factor [Clostridiales bacterium]|jgi:RNA polymerase sigma-70 factor (ECF subfamily)|nr:polymerase ECF-type sigma factor [Clostridiales bacterium]
MEGGLLLQESISKEKAEMIFKEHSNYIYRTAVYLTKSKELADDITQETFIQAFLKYDTFDSTKSLQPWLYKIALNTTRNMLRKHKWLKYTDQMPEMSSLYLVENSVLKSEEKVELWKQINGLSMKSKEVFVLHFYSGMKLREISEILDIPIGTCKSRLNYAINTLRKQIPHNEFDFLGEGGELYETI